MGNYLLRSLNEEIKYITNYYKKLVSYTKQNKSVGSINEWIIDNFYYISEQYPSIKGNLTSNSNIKLKKDRKSEINDLIYSILSKESFKLSSRMFFEEMNNYQIKTNDYLSYQEIEYINISLRIIIIKEINNLCHKLNYKLEEKNNLEKIFSNIDKKIYSEEAFDIHEFISIDNSLLDKPFYIEELNYRLNEIGQYSGELFKELNELLENNNMSLKDIIKKEHDQMTSENILMVNLFDSLKKATKYKIEFIFSKISFSENALINEEAKIFDTMYESSKIEYRRKIKEIVEKKKLKEYDYVKELVEKANSLNKHVSFCLFEEKNYELISKIYISFIVIFTIIISFLISYKMGWGSFFILLIPICGLITDVISQILLKTTRSRSLIRIKLEGTLKETESTMVVIPTLIKDVKKIKEMFGNLELYYLSNRTDNLYYCLLGDAASEATKDMPYDKKIVEAGIKAAYELNKKYGKNIFHFIYRNRFFNEGENSYLGYERKRGALNHFNALLLNKLSKEEQESYFRCNTLSNFKTKIKYVITLDADTKLLLNTALKLIGTMMHPMNKPILSEDGRKVIKGYAIMQPKISIDVEVTSKSEYSQLFGGLGGLDIYSPKSFDLYQDVFNEGSFVGKGIYDLEIFDKILSQTFPENLILSHDLIEGNYLRCGFINDVEMFDNYPSKYFNDAMRHHRWTRGDWQIIGWLKKKVRNLKNETVDNPINLIEKWKIFDNLRRSLMSPFLLLIILYGFTFSKLSPSFSLFLVSFIIAIPIFFYLISNIIGRQKYDLFLKYYLDLITGFLAVVLRSTIVITILPYEAFLYVDAVVKSLYRMFISKKRLLNWITSEEVEATSKNNLITYIKAFKYNYLFAIIILACAYFLNYPYFYLAITLAFSWFFAPFLMSFISRDLKSDEIVVNDQIRGEIREIALRTWKFFDDFLVKEYNYLMPDNYQPNRKSKLDLRTSPTNIGLSITSIISASELKLVKEDEAVDRLNNIIKNVDKLEKWHGHLFNWYSISTYKALNPLFVSTADSGNFVAALYVLRGFLEKTNKYKVLQYKVNKMINEVDFSRLYNKDLDVFAVGFNVNEQILTPYHYNNFLSESRLASFLAIAKGDVPFKHWFCLDKTLTKYKFYKGVVSWTGTMFEYFMPLIFMKTYDHTLLDESYLFSYYAQKEFIKEADPSLPWGITESAYNELDDSQSYKYKAFGIPHLKFHDNETPQIVIAPYGSILAITKYPIPVYNNIKKFKKLGMYGEYGLYEAYDNEDEAIVKSYFAHHQGMILSSIANYLKDNVIQDYFHYNKSIQSIEILLKEKVQIRPYIDLKIAKYKKYNYKRDVQVSDVREQEGLCSIPEVGVLSNGLYSTFINDRGVGFSKYKNLQINRYRKVTEENYGMFLYIKNLKTKTFWTNTYYPSNTKPDKYHVVFASDRIKYMREDDNIITSTEITVVKDHNAEIRKITIENNQNKEVELELTSYSEVIMSRLEEDIAHRAFNSITITSEIDKKTQSLLFRRNSRTKEETEYFIINRMFLEDNTSSFEYETSRANFIGRNNSTINPDAIVNSKKLSSNFHDLIDPIMSIRKKIKIKPNDKKVLYLIVGFGKSRKQVHEIVNAYNSSKSIYNAFESATILNNMRNAYANLNASELCLYNTMLKYIYQTVAIDDQRMEILKQNNISQKELWKYGVSGNIPLILLTIDKVEDSGYINQVLQAYEFYKSRAIYVDIAIINGEKDEKKDMIKKYVDNLMYRINNLNYFENSPGGVYVLSDYNEEDVLVLKTYAKIYIDANLPKSFNEQILDLFNIENKEIGTINTKLLTNIKQKTNDKLTFNNEFGGFVNKGREYLITSIDTPTPWINILANKTFGTVISNNLGGFTYAYNSREYKITSWSNDYTSDPYSECIYINGYRFIPNTVRHGFGYSIFEANAKDYNYILKVFVPKEDNIKIYELSIEEKNKTDKKLDIDFVVKPVLGVSEEQTNRHILSVFDKNKNSLILQNMYSDNFKNEKVFVSSSENIKKVDNELVSSKSISISIDTKKTNVVYFTIGCANNVDDLLKKYNKSKKISEEFELVKKSWEDKFSYIKVKTPDKSFDYMINGWLLYQVYSSRLYSKAGFYQVGGAVGFRDQLQDSMGLLYSNEQETRKQILKHASHQFVEGDVLHWWHEELMFGARTRFSDDYLWLIYVTYEYLKITGDYSILDEKVCFVEGESLRDDESEKGINYVCSNTTETLYYHLKLCINKALNQFGKHHLPLMGSGDWNDGMNKVGHEGKGESVWVGFFLYDILKKMREVSAKKDELDYSKMCDEKANTLKESLNKSAFEGSWYLRAFYDNGAKLGSIDNDECKIDLICQSWAILTEVIEENNIVNVLNAVEERLVDKENNIIKLLDPAFGDPKNDPGYISYYIKGVRENGGQYTHASLWYIMSLIKVGQIDKAYEYYSMINPINRTIDKEGVLKYKTEPYVVAADIYSNVAQPGRGGWTWYTGSASWSYKIAIEQILGISKNGNILNINPHISSKWKSYEMEYKYIDTIYNIKVNNPNGLTHQVKEITLDNKKVEFIELVNDKNKHEVNVNMGG